MEKEEKIVLVDADSLIYYEAHKEDLEESIQGIDRRVRRILEDCNTNKYIMFLTEGKCFRYDRAKSREYKGSRKNRDKPTWFNILRGYLKDKYGAVSYKGLEADDCVLYFGYKIDNSIISSPDKDVLGQAVGIHYNYQMTSDTEAKGFVEVSQNEANMFLYTQMITGDATDGIPGIEGVGPAGANKILSGYMVEEGRISVESVVLDAYIQKYGTVEGINRFHETFKLVYLLRNDSDMMREVKYIPDMPEIQEYTSVKDSTDGW